MQSIGTLVTGGGGERGGRERGWNTQYHLQKRKKKNKTFAVFFLTKCTVSYILNINLDVGRWTYTNAKDKTDITRQPSNLPDTNPVSLLAVAQDLEPLSHKDNHPPILWAVAFHKCSDTCHQSGINKRMI